MLFGWVEIVKDYKEFTVTDFFIASQTILGLKD